jgi:hypothetical protein
MLGIVSVPELSTKPGPSLIPVVSAAFLPFQAAAGVDHSSTIKVTGKVHP